MYDPKRISSRVLVLLSLAGVLGLVGVGIRPIVGGRPSWLPETESTVDVPLYRKAAGRVLAASRELRRSARGAERLGVLIGGSSLIHGVDPTQMDTGAEWRWLSLAPSGAYLIDDCALAQLTLEGSAQPDVLVFLITPSHLAVLPGIHDDTSTFDTDELAFHVRRREWFKAQTDVANLMLIPWNVLYPNRTRISRYLRQMSFEAQQDVFHAMAFSRLAPYEPDPTPWAVDFPYPGAVRMPDGWMEFVYHGLEKSKLFEPSSYPANGQGIRSLADTVRRARGVGTEVILVLMAEGSEVRSRMPREAETRLREAVHREFGDSSPMIVDLRGSVVDDMFLDQLHLSDKGRNIFTRILSDRLRQVLFSRAGSISDHAAQ
jgi:hypothetical protein